MKINLETPTQCIIAAKLLEVAEHYQFDTTDFSEVGYNSNSGYVYLYSEEEQLQIGLADYAYHRGEEPEFIFSEPCCGEEFFGSNPEDVALDYFKWAEQALEDGDIVESDIVDTIYCGGVCWEFNS